MRDHHVTICSQCNEFPCEIIASWDRGDSQVSHLQCVHNLHTIKKQGYEAYLKTQSLRMKLLDRLLKDFNDGRSKSFYCLASTLLPLESIESLIQLLQNTDQSLTPKAIREAIESQANKDSVILKLRKL